MKLNKLLFLPILILLLYSCQKEEGLNPSQLGSWTTYNTGDGLAGNDVWCIMEDTDGNMWFGTSSHGASRYDGENWYTITTAQGLANNTVLSIVQENNGDIWFGTVDGITVYDGSDFVSYYLYVGGVPVQTMVYDMIIDDDQDIIIPVYGRSIVVWDGSGFFTVDIPVTGYRYINTLIQDRDGIYWAATDAGVFRFDEVTFTYYDESDGLSSSMIQSIFQDSKGRIWLGPWDGASIHRWDGNTFISYDPYNDLGELNRISSIAEDLYGNIWFGTAYTGAIRYDGMVMKTFQLRDGLSAESVHCIFQDSKKNLWFGTVNGGVCKYVPPSNF